MVAKMKRVILNDIIASQMTPYSDNPDLPNVDLHRDDFCPLSAIRERKRWITFQQFNSKKKKLYKKKTGVKVERIMLWVIWSSALKAEQPVFFKTISNEFQVRWIQCVWGRNLYSYPHFSNFMVVNKQQVPHLLLPPRCLSSCCGVQTL